jgi:hypothetical protein
MYGFQACLFALFFVVDDLLLVMLYPRCFHAKEQARTSFSRRGNDKA